MQDRIPAPGRENRIRITQDDGTIIAGKLEYDDQATQEGSPYTKGNVLPDEVCDLMALDHDGSEPDDAFRYLALMQASVYGKIVVTVTSNGLPLQGINFTIGSNSVTTNSKGQASIILSPGNYTATFSNTLDLNFSPASMQVTATKGKINYYNVTATESATTQATFTSSTNISFSGRVSDFDIFCVGGGGSGGAGAGFRYGSNYTVILAGIGGGGGYTTTVKNVSNTGSVLSVVVGSGGTAVSANINKSTNTASGVSEKGNAGGETYVMRGGVKICAALGGEGGSGGYSYDQFRAVSGANGGSGSGLVGWQYSISVGDSGENGEDGETGSYPYSATVGKGQGTTTRAFGESSGTAYAPAGGSAGAWGSGETGVAGTGGGKAAGACATTTPYSISASQGTTAGAGGGGAAISYNTAIYSANLTATSGAGRAGLVIIRWRYAV